MHWYKASAKQGNVNAPHNLADILKFNGDYKQAFSWISKAASFWYKKAKAQGSKDATTFLANLEAGNED